MFIYEPIIQQMLKVVGCKALEQGDLPRNAGQISSPL